jgi:hypothetical protein
MDDDVRALPPEILAFFEANYEPAEVAPLWRLKDVWLDGGRSLDFGPGPTDVLAGRGWSGAEQADGRTFRLATSRRSSIRLPVRRPAECRAIVVRGGLQRVGAKARMEVSINRVSIGAVSLLGGWHDSLLPLPHGVLRPGVNALQFSYEPSPNRSPPSDSGRGFVFAMDELKLDCDSSRR